jgi:hypothetical protein
MEVQMAYQHFSRAQFFKTFSTEQKVRDWLWQTRFPSGFQCHHCKSEKFYQHTSRPEIRTCRECLKQIRLRAGTLFEHSKLPLRIWFQAIQLLMQGKRGISALELKRVLKLGSYQTAWMMLQKIRAALKDRDQRYKLQGIIEVDGASFGHKKNRKSVLVAVESKDWVDDNGKPRPRAGFAKIALASETKQDAQHFVNQAIERDSVLHADRKNIYPTLENVQVDSRMTQNLLFLDGWLPWVNKFISNAKAWVLGTHHSIRSKYLDRYLAEYTYRFNRRHDPDGLFQRALRACTLAAPRRAYALAG